MGLVIRGNLILLKQNFKEILVVTLFRLSFLLFLLMWYWLQEYYLISIYNIQLVLYVSSTTTILQNIKVKSCWIPLYI